MKPKSLCLNRETLFFSTKYKFYALLRIMIFAATFTIWVTKPLISPVILFFRESSLYTKGTFSSYLRYERIKDEISKPYSRSWSEMGLWHSDVQKYSLEVKAKCHGMVLYFNKRNLVCCKINFYIFLDFFAKYILHLIKNICRCVKKWKHAHQCHKMWLMDFL